MDFRKDYDWDKVTNPITDEQARKWVDALRSDEYTQGKRYLRTLDNTYCCLGVANSIFDLKFEGSCSVLRTDDRDFTLLPSSLQVDLYMLNDVEDWSFSRIADFIEEGFQLKKVA